VKVDTGLGAGDPAASAREAEAAGFDGVWASEINHDPFLPLAVAASATDRVQLGTAIAVAFARTPMTLAQVGWDLQTMSGGRFVLGLGSQVKAHITRRFDMPWSHPAPRMREMVLAIRHIWTAWDDGTGIDFRGDFYNHTLMTPNFSPGPQQHGQPPIFVAGVGERMTQAAGEVADGYICHGFTTERYVREVTLPALEAGAAKAGRQLSDVEISLPAFVATGETEEQLAAAVAASRSQVAFYASTPSYRGVLELHGWGDLQGELNALTKQGRWAEMGDAIDDEVLRTFAVVGEPDAIVPEIVRRYGGLVQRISLNAAVRDRPAALDLLRSAP
jgi:probable F420-dependent oxidoreductase